MSFSSSWCDWIASTLVNGRNYYERAFKMFSDINFNEDSLCLQEVCRSCTSKSPKKIPHQIKMWGKWFMLENLFSSTPPSLICNSRELEQWRNAEHVRSRGSTMKSLSGIYVHRSYLCCCRLNTSISNERNSRYRSIFKRVFRFFSATFRCVVTVYDVDWNMYKNGVNKI